MSTAFINHLRKKQRMSSLDSLYQKLAEDDLSKLLSSKEKLLYDISTTESVMEIAGMIEIYPELTVEIIRRANNPIYGGPLLLKPADSLPAAIYQVGYDDIVSTIESFNDDLTSNLYMRLRSDIMQHHENEE